jgi:hypothetical protein
MSNQSSSLLYGPIPPMRRKSPPVPVGPSEELASPTHRRIWNLN